jgi:para-nitrobenzyl esterase
VDPSQPDSRPRFETDALGDVWQWEGMTTPVEQIVVDNPSLYTIRFQSDGEVEIRADCNRGFGRYTVTEERKLEFGPFGVTRAICPPESLSDRYLRELARATTLFFADGDLYLELPYDSGTLKFSRHAEQSAAE